MLCSLTSKDRVIDLGWKQWLSLWLFNFYSYMWTKRWLEINTRKQLPIELQIRINSLRQSIVSKYSWYAYWSNSFNSTKWHVRIKGLSESEKDPRN